MATKKKSKKSSSSSSSEEKQPKKQLVWTASMTWDQTLALVKSKFERIAKYTQAICDKKINGFALFGERGLGKSRTMRDILETFKGSRTIKKFKGKISPLQVYNMLWENKDSDNIVWFDDCDSAFTDVDSMNILKAAMDTDEPRDVCWNSNSKLVIEPEFKFKGRVIVSTNFKLSKSEHLAAFLDRMHSLNFILSAEEKMVWMEYLALGKNPKDKAGTVGENHLSPMLTTDVTMEVLKWIRDHMNEIGTKLSIRTYKKVSDLASFDPEWQEMAMAQIEQQSEVEGADEEIISVQEINEALETGKAPKKKASKKESHSHKKSTTHKGALKPKTGKEGNYRQGTMIDTIYQNLMHGKTLSMSGLEKKWPGKSSAISTTIDRLKRHGMRSGKWTIKMSGDSISMGK